MDERGIWLHPDVQVVSLLRARPAAQEALERLGLDPWADHRVSLGVLSAAKGIGWAELESALRGLPESLPEIDWDSASLPALLDHLVRDHADIKERMLPPIRSVLTRAMTEGHPGKSVGSLADAWPRFSAELAAHLKEEEVFLFPRLLHYEWCLRHRGQHPDFTGGSVNVYIALHLLGNENRQMDSLDRFMAEWETELPAGTGASSAESESRRLVEAFLARLKRHNALESEVLYPRAKALEKALYDAAISGSAVFFSGRD